MKREKTSEMIESGPNKSECAEEKTEQDNFVATRTHDKGESLDTPDILHVALPLLQKIVTHGLSLPRKLISLRLMLQL